MNQTKINTVKNYLLNTVAETLAEKTKAEATAMQRKIATRTAKLNALHAKMLPLFNQFNELKEELTDFVNKDNEFSVSTVYAQLREYETNSEGKNWIVQPRVTDFYRSGNVTLYCSKTNLALAKECVRLIERYTIELTMGADIASLEAFTAQLKAKLNA